MGVLYLQNSCFTSGISIQGPPHHPPMNGARELKEGPKKKESLSFEGVRKSLGEALCFTELGPDYLPR